VVGTKSERFSYLQFLDAWDRCVPQTSGLDLGRALREALNEPLHPNAAHYPERDQLLVRACAALSRYSAPDPFYLAGEDAGRLLGASEGTARRLFARMIRDGILRPVARGSNLTGLASTYRYVPPP
jgi:hypothetical protein